jgi:hypothetical protein
VRTFAEMTGAERADLRQWIDAGHSLADVVALLRVRGVKASVLDVSGFLLTDEEGRQPVFLSRREREILMGLLDAELARRKERAA